MINKKLELVYSKRTKIILRRASCSSEGHSSCLADDVTGATEQCFEYATKMRVFKKPILLELQERERSHSVLAELPRQPLSSSYNMQQLQKRITPIVINRQAQDNNLLKDLNIQSSNPNSKLTVPKKSRESSRQRLPPISPKA